MIKDLIFYSFIYICFLINVCVYNFKILANYINKMNKININYIIEEFMKRNFKLNS